MKKIGITGNIACGKSAAFQVIKAEGCSIIDCDDIVKELYLEKDVILELKKLLPGIINDDKVDLKKVSDLIFDNNSAKAEFENYIFKKVKEKISEFFEKNNSEKKVFVIAPLLFEAGFKDLFDEIIFISAEEDIRKQRLISRKSLLSEMADKVINSQVKEAEKTKKSDYVIKNNGTLEEFERTVKKFINQI